MDKAALLNALVVTGQIDRFSRTDNWERAFEEYNKIHGDNLKPNCGSCFRKVQKWLLG
jgi:hypothetical protein